jgi:hypothetical protein
MKKMQGQLDPQVKAKMDEMQQQMMGLQKENQELKNQTAIKMQQDKTKSELGHEKNAVADQISLRELQSEFAKAQKEHEREMVKMQAAMEADSIKREQDFQIKVMEAMMKDEQSQKQWAMKQLDAAHKESMMEKSKKPEKAAAPSAPPVINITNVIPKQGDKTIRVKRGKSGSIEGASVSEE